MKGKQNPLKTATRLDFGDWCKQGVGIVLLVIGGSILNSCTEVGVSAEANGNTNGQQHEISRQDAMQMPLMALPTIADPMVWGAYGWADPADSIIAGKRDTSAACLEWKNREPDSSDAYTDYYEYEYTDITYRPLYQSLEEYKNSISYYEDIALLNPGKLYIKGDYKFVGDINRGVHVYDNTNAENPILVGFYYLPGNIDIAIKNNTMYANSYSNLLALDITDPQNITLQKVLVKAFPDVFKYGQSVVGEDGGIAVAWAADTTLHCGEDNYRYVLMDASAPMEMANSSSSGAEMDAVDEANKDSFGEGGSMARFALNSTYLYAVDREQINIFDVTVDAAPVDKGEVSIPSGWEIETIFQTDKALFIGSMAGMFIFIKDEEQYPVFASSYSHITSCDPVVVQGDMAYVTLSSGTRCANGNNQLDILDISDLYTPVLIASHDMVNPQGLAVKDGILYLADGYDGFKIFNVQDAENIQLLGALTGFHAYDVIVKDNQATVIGNDGVYEIDVSDTENPTIMSSVEATGDKTNDGYYLSPNILIGASE
jgi:hypothetical protein